MGYRSEVSIAVYGEYDKMAAFIAAARLTEDFSTIWEECEMYPYRFVNEMLNKSQSMYMLCASFCDVKWYDHYSDVQAWQKFFDLATVAESAGINCEFTRVGEDYGDVRYEWSGDHCEHFVRPYTQISEDLPPEEDDNVRAG